MEWTFEENKAFENALAELSLLNKNPNLIQKMWLRVPGKTGDQIKEHYNALLKDVEMIENGYFDEKLDDLYDPLSKHEVTTSKVSTVVPNYPRVPRRKGSPWSDNEHEAFLIGLRKYGKGDWKSISRNCVRTRSPSQVASHAQKYFLKLEKLAQQHGYGSRAQPAQGSNAL